jgi:excisionase family DNA binding protein
MSARSERARTGLRNGPATPRKRGNPSKGLLGAHDAPRDAQTLTANRLLTAGELAARWQVPKQHVYRLTRQGAVPVVRLGRYFRYRVEAIEEWERGGGANA